MRISDKMIEVVTSEARGYKMTSAIEEYYKLKMRLDEPIKADDVNFEPFKRVIRGDRERLEKRRCILLQELEDINVKIAGLNYVEEQVLMIMGQDNE